MGYLSVFLKAFAVPRFYWSRTVWMESRLGRGVGFLVCSFGRLLFGSLGLSVGFVSFVKKGAPRAALGRFSADAWAVFLWFTSTSCMRVASGVLEGREGCLDAILGALGRSVGDVGLATRAAPPKTLQ